MATGSVEIIEYVAGWQQALTAVNTAPTLYLSSSALQDLNALITLNEAALNYLRKLKASNHPALGVLCQQGFSFPHTHNVDAHFDFLYAQLVSLSHLERKSDALSFAQRDALLFNIAKILAISLMIGMGAYYFWLLPIKFICEFASMMALTLSLFRGEPAFLPFSMLAIFCVSLDVFNAVNSATGIFAFPLAIISSPYFPLAMLPFGVLAVCYVLNRYLSNPAELTEDAEAVQSNEGTNPKALFLTIRDVPRMQFFREHKELCKKIDEAYQTGLTR